jgi:hypothetical protein
MVEKVDAVLDHAQTVVIGTKDPDFQSVPGAHAQQPGSGRLRAH